MFNKIYNKLVCLYNDKQRENIPSLSIGESNTDEQLIAASELNKKAYKRLDNYNSGIALVGSGVIAFILGYGISWLCDRARNVGKAQAKIMYNEELVQEEISRRHSQNEETK